MRTIAIIPAFNEYQHLSSVVEKTVRYVDHIIVVDDGSKQPLLKSDVARSNVSVLRHCINLGKGAALTTGVQYAQKLHADYVVFLDADGQHDPAEIPKLLDPLYNDAADIIFGVRHFQKRMPFVARMGNVFLTQFLHLMFGVGVSDTQSGFRAFKLSVYEKLSWRSPRYAVETEMIVNAGKHKLRFQEVPISTIYLDKYRGTTILDGIRIFCSLIMWRFL